MKYLTQRNHVTVLVGIVVIALVALMTGCPNSLSGPSDNDSPDPGGTSGVTVRKGDNHLQHYRAYQRR